MRACVCGEHLDSIEHVGGRIVGMVDGRPHGCDLGAVDRDPEDFGIVLEYDARGLAHVRGVA